MNKAFTKENDDEEPEQPEIPAGTHKNYVTPTGFAQLQDEMRLLLQERPKIVEVVSWAAGNGDRSENGDYLYGKKRLREIDRRVRYLTKRLETAIVVNPELQKNLTKVFFGATVTYAEEGAAALTVQIVGVDEADLAKHKISFTSPLAKALLKSEVGDIVKCKAPQGDISVKVVAIHY